MNLQSTILTAISGSTKKTPSGWHTINCPMCIKQGHTRPDKRHRGGFKFSDVVSYHCFNCNYKASFTPGRLIGRKLQTLLIEIGVSEQKVKELQFEAMKLKDDDIEIGKKYDSVTDFKAKNLPKGARLLRDIINDDNPPADALFVYKYIMDRDLEFYKDFYWSPDPYMKINKRLLVPFMAKGVTVGYTGRVIEDIPNVPKYYSDVQPGYIFNIDNLHTDRKYVIITEGVLDALSINAVSSLGNKLTQGQIDLINATGKTIIVCPDRDKSGSNLIDVAVENNWMVSFPKWGTGIKDCADAVKQYGRLYTLKSVIDSAVSNKAKIQVYKKIGVA